MPKVRGAPRGFSRGRIGFRTSTAPRAVRGLPLGAGRFAPGRELIAAGLGPVEGAAPGIRGRRNGENSKTKGARGVASGVLEAAGISGVAVVVDRSGAPARAFRISG